MADAVLAAAARSVLTVYTGLRAALAAAEAWVHPVGHWENPVIPSWFSAIRGCNQSDFPQGLRLMQGAGLLAGYPCHGRLQRC